MSSYTDDQLGFFGRKRRKKTESRVAATGNVASQNTSLVKQVNSQFQQAIPQLQSQLAQAQAALKNAQKKATAETNNTLGYIALGVAGISTAYTLYQKFSS